MAQARSQLARLRTSSAAWQELRYEAATGADGKVSDRNGVQRAQVLWALQYDRRPDDLPLIRWLAEQEALCSGDSACHAMLPELAGFLLAEHRKVEDVWLHWKIKRSNFDVGTAYDQEYLVAAGVQATIDFVRGSGQPDRGAVLDFLLDEHGQPWVSEEDLARWWQSKRSRFPADPAAEDGLTWVDRAQLIGDRELARRELDRWSVGRQRDENTLRTLRRLLADLGDYAEAARAQRENLGYAVTPKDSASAWQELAALERQAGDHRAAWDALCECRRSLEGVSGWTQLGYGRMYVHEMFLLAGSAEGDLAAVVFAEADRQARNVSRLPVVVFRAAADAAAHVGEKALAEHYRKVRDAEQRRIDAI